MDVTVRLAGPGDAEGIAGVHVRSWRAAYRGIVPDDVLDELSIPRRAATWRERLSQPAEEERTLVAESGGAVVGFAAAGPSRDPFAKPDTAELYAIYVDPKGWGGGVGATLLDHATDELRRRGFNRMTLWVLAADQGARRFYESRGWRADGSTKPYLAGSAELEEVRYGVEL